MQSLGAAIRAAFADRWTGDEATAIEDALDAAAEWGAGRLPLREAAKQGAVADREGVRVTAARTQCRAVLASDPSDPRRADLTRLLDALVSRQPGVVLTTKGVFLRDDCYARGVVIHDPKAPWETN